MTTYETNHEAKALFVILMGAILFVFAQLPNSIVINHAFFEPTPETQVVEVATPNGVSGKIVRTVHDVPPETWRDNIAIDLPKGNDVMTADWNEVECLAVNIYHESRNQSQLGQELVAQVVVNRMENRHYPNTACEVIRQSYQFSWTHDGKSDQVRDRVAYEKAYTTAIEYLLLKKVADVENAKRLLNYHADYVNPGWYNLTVAVVEGAHIFYTRG